MQATVEIYHFMVFVKGQNFIKFPVKSYIQFF